MAPLSSSAKRILKEMQSNSGSTLDSATKNKRSAGKKMTVKELNEMLKFADHVDLIDLLEDLFEDCPAALCVLDSYVPDSSVPEDIITHRCFHCKEGDSKSLRRLEGVRVCQDCLKRVFHAITRDKMIKIFEFSKSEANKMKRSAPAGAYSGYRYEWCTVVKEVKKRDGSFFKFVEQSKFDRSSTPTTGSYLAVTASLEDKKRVTHHALKASKEASLKKLVRECAKIHPTLKRPDGPLDMFFPCEEETY